MRPRNRNFSIRSIVPSGLRTFHFLDSLQHSTQRPFSRDKSSRKSTEYEKHEIRILQKGACLYWELRQASTISGRSPEDQSPFLFFHSWPRYLQVVLTVLRLRGAGFFSLLFLLLSTGHICIQTIAAAPNTPGTHHALPDVSGLLPPLWSDCPGL